MGNIFAIQSQTPLRKSDFCFYVFSSNAAPFDSEKAFWPFAIFALLECNGDFKEAARLLSGHGYGDIDFDQEQFNVHASKTEHHGNGGVRTVPIFPELKLLFQEAFKQAKDGTVYCITKYRDKGVNLRIQMNKTIKRADLEP